MEINRRYANMVKRVKEVKETKLKDYILLINHII